MYPMNVNRIGINKSPGSNMSPKAVQNPNLSFKGLLQQEINKNQGLKFSKHAMERLQERNIRLTNQEVDRLNHAISRAADKGIKETLIIMDNKAFIASVPNRTVITAATDKQLKENIFTNIDGAIFV